VEEVVKAGACAADREERRTRPLSRSSAVRGESKGLDVFISARGGGSNERPGQRRFRGEQRIEPISAGPGENKSAFTIVENLALLASGVA